MKPALIVLAAGASRRLGQIKALVELGGSTALERIAAAALASTQAPRLLVTGAHAAEIGARCPAGLEPLFNPEHARGRSGGLALAAARLAGRDALLWPVDCPLVARATIEALCAEWARAGAPPRGWLAPRIGSGARAQHGHPLLLGCEILSEARALHPDEPLRALRARAAPLLALEVADAAVLDDLDGPQDLDRLRARLG